ncbi:MAG: tripartite tricarboxylate transporter substrate-binding protein [Betaproteobacteria bacterium]
MFRFIAVLATAAAFLPGVANAQAYPNKAIRLIVPFAAGAGTDVVARTVMQRAGEILGQAMVVENRVGAGGNIGAEAGAKSPADGYTITILSTIHAANQSFYRKLGYSMENDFVPVVEIGVSPTLWVVRADLPVRTAQELAQLAKSAPGKLTYGSGGASHPAELFKALTGGDIIVVPYKGVSAAMQDLLAGRVDMSVAGFLDTDAHIRSGKLRALATTNTERLVQLPDVPAMREFLPGYDFTLWYGIFVPRDTPAAVVATLRAAVLRALESPEVIARLQALAIRPAKSSSEAFAARVHAEVARWADTVKKAKIELQD